MTQEEKELLLKDLCARLPYGVVVNYKEGEHDQRRWKIETLYAPAYSKSGTLIDIDHDGWIGYSEYQGLGMSSGSRSLHLGKVLPHLRPMSSMTEEEFESLKQYSGLKYDQLDLAEFPNNHKCLDFYLSEVPSYTVILVFDWLNVHHFDYRLLIERGLALEAPEGMYKTE